MATTLVISGVAQLGGTPFNGGICNAYKASRFPNWVSSNLPPAQNDPPPAGAADAGPVTSGTNYGGVGHFLFVVATDEPYFISVVSGGVTGWQYGFPFALPTAGVDPTGSTSGQVYTSTGPSTTPTFQTPTTINLWGGGTYNGAAESTSSSTYVDLPTPGPSATCTIGSNGKVLILARAALGNTASGSTTTIGIGIDGALPPTSGFQDIVSWTETSAQPVGNLSAGMVFLSGLTPGQHTFKMMYKTSGGTSPSATFIARYIVAIPPPI